MPRLSIISHFYGHHERVLTQIRHWNEIAPEFLADIEFILVDDCSEARLSLPRTAIDLRYFRITSDIPWNQGGARNLGAFHATGNWALFFDIDQKLELPSVSTIFKLIALPNLEYTWFSLRIRNLVDVLTNQSLPAAPSTFLVNLREFKMRCMYDEDFAGHYGFEDLYAMATWERSGGSRMLLEEPIFFEDMRFGTTDLDRDTSVNKSLYAEKLRAPPAKPKCLLRFDWHEVALEDTSAAARQT